jgi:hypothetical protein
LTSLLLTNQDQTIDLTDPITAMVATADQICSFVQEGNWEGLSLAVDSTTQATITGTPTANTSATLMAVGTNGGTKTQRLNITFTGVADEYTVSNSDDSYSVDITDDLELPDVDITVNEEHGHSVGTVEIVVDENNPAAVNRTVTINPARGPVYWLNQDTFNGLTTETDSTYIIDDDLAEDVIETNYDPWE